LALRSRLETLGATIKTTLVANHGFHPPAGPLERKVHFMLFEMASGRLDLLGITLGEGEFFFGHFIVPSVEDKLTVGVVSFIELIAWDPSKGVFNFYEFTRDRGDMTPRWHYRGDSLDILADVALLHRQDTPAFGERLRCSGCHTAGGPIMKELNDPHAHWWTAEPVPPFAQWPREARLVQILKSLVDANELAHGVRAGLAKLEASERFQQAKKAQSLQALLRPLFCPVELNIESDTARFDQRGPQIAIPAAFFVDPRLAQTPVSIARTHYETALADMQVSFPNTSRVDADHAWLAPVKAASDMLAIETLVQQGVLDREFVHDVLAVDLGNPVFSQERCHLLRLVPQTPDWQAFFQAVSEAGAAPNADPAARELLHNLMDPSRHSQFHQARAEGLLQQCHTRLQSPDGVRQMYQLLAQRRLEVRASQMSQNPQGEILEPDFRTVFPHTPGATPRGLKLTEACEVVAQ
jgi:hypothetical protein